MNNKLNACKALAMKTIVFIAACLLLQACNSNSTDTPSSTLDEAGTVSSSQPVVVLPDVDILPGGQPPENTLQNTMWRLSSLERDDGSIYSQQPDLSYFLNLNDDNFRIQFWCVYREGNYSVLNDGVLTTTSLNDMEVFSCPPPPTTEPADIEDLLTSFFDGKTLMFVQTDAGLELRSVSNEVLRFAACEMNCLNVF